MTLGRLQEILDTIGDIYKADTEVEVESVVYHDSVSNGIITGVILHEDSITLEMMGKPEE